MHTATTSAASTKPCAQCGATVATGILVCSGCTKENLIAFRKSHPWLFERKAA